MLNTPFAIQLLNLESSSFNYGDICKEFEVKKLTFDESLQLFNLYAFGKSCSIEINSMEYSRKVVKHCGGFPLDLKVLGSSLSGKSKNVWKNALEKLEAIPDSKSQKILRISCDSMEDDYDKNLFLDIACFFNGRIKITQLQF
ncbi:disease resistance protein RML1A-like [Durio zibethinus]|uniref:Disease resistance protein RML1A-like n=1 Tax=Durio zibethinus TaxID=66656 RepID=A0A6P5YC25_DURZI|nr:disease resistance protein RML1A-like [Durio zibethinus]